MSDLTLYNSACAALAQAVTADEVMQVRATAEGIKAVAHAAKNFDLEINAIKLRTHAEARLGELLEEGERSGLIAGHGGDRKDQDSSVESCSRATLREIGVDSKLSARARKLSGIGAQALGTVLDQFERESRGRGKPALTVITDVIAKRNAASRRQIAQELSDCAALRDHGRLFPVVYADPAWRRKAGIGNRAYENHYATMPWDEIIGMPVAKRLLPDAWLFLWIPRAHLLALHPTEIDTPLGRTTVKLPLAYAVAQGWGFDAYSTCCVWTKTDDEHPDDHGSGLLFWDQDEILCLFKRGRGLPMPDGATKFGSNYRARAEDHSAKPTYYRDMINTMTGGLPVLELFAREDGEHILPPNFYTWGNQSKGTADPPIDGVAVPVSHDAQTGEVRA